jgi:two-component system chemotaxis response regulator CheB
MIDISQVDAIVVGGSAGAFAALKLLLPALPPDLDVPVLIVMHVPPDRPSVIPEIFGRDTHVPVKEADDKELLAPGTVYFAPAGYHLLVETDRTLSLSADPPVHHSRPSIDVLFESAADAFGSRLLTVILSGASADGAAGTRAAHARGAFTIVQRPESAEQPVMPQAALDASTPSAVLELADIASLLASFHPARRDRKMAGGHG